MPVKPEFSPQYELGYAFQLVTICMSAYIYFGVDSVALSMVIFACAQLDIIKDKIISVGTNCGIFDQGSLANLLEEIVKLIKILSFVLLLFRKCRFSYWE